MRFSTLVRHSSASAAAPAIEIEAAALILRSGALELRYRVRGDVGRIRLPVVQRPATRADELWRHTCFEAFVKPRGSESYLELNFSPSHAWAAYSFEGYRRGMHPAREIIETPTITCRADRDSLTLSAALHIGAPRSDDAVGLSAVIEDEDGNVSHWALAHPRTQPDFHDSAAWTGGLQRFGRRRAEDPA